MALSLLLRPQGSRGRKAVVASFAKPIVRFASKLSELEWIILAFLCLRRSERQRRHGPRCRFAVYAVRETGGRRVARLRFSISCSPRSLQSFRTNDGRALGWLDGV